MSKENHKNWIREFKKILTKSLRFMMVNASDLVEFLLQWTLWTILKFWTLEQVDIWITD